jgi:hypothetical protein
MKQKNTFHSDVVRGVAIAGIGLVVGVGVGYAVSTGILGGKNDDTATDTTESLLGDGFDEMADMMF